MRRRGSILILAIFFLFVVELLAFAFARLIPVELLSAGRTRQDIGAGLAAQAALDYTVAFMENELAEGREPTSASLRELHQRRVVGDWNCEVVATPDGQTPPNGNSNQRVYLLTSKASQQAGGHVYASLRTAVKQESFASYCRFVDQWTPSTWVACGPSQIRGRFHTNDTFHIMIYNGFYTGPRDGNWPDGPTFWGKVTAAGKDPGSKDGVRYRSDGNYENPPYRFDKKTRDKYYKLIFKGGRSNLQTGVAKIPMPPEPSFKSLASAAWGAGTPPDASDGRLHFNPGGGIYADGPVSELTLDASSSGLAKQTFQTSRGRMTVVEVHSGSFVTPDGTVVPKGSTAILGPNGQERISSELPNGVIYVNGRVEGVGGSNRGSHTLATRQDIELANSADKASITQANNEPPSKFDGSGPSLKSNPDHHFGMVCRHLVVPDFEHHGQNLYLYAAIVCSNGDNGSVEVRSRNNGDHGTAKLVIVGSLVEDVRDYWASTTEAAGYGAVLQHDESLSDQPPPNFPCTSRLRLQQVVFDVK